MTDEAEVTEEVEVTSEVEPPKPVAYVRVADVEKVRRSGQTARVTLYGPDTQGYQAGEDGLPGWKALYALPFA